MGTTGIDPVYREVVVSFRGGMNGTLTSMFTAYQDAACAESPTAGDSGTIAGTYTVGAEVTSTF